MIQEEKFCAEHPAVDGGPPPEITSEQMKTVWSNWCGGSSDAGAK